MFSCSYVRLATSSFLWRRFTSLHIRAAVCSRGWADCSRGLAGSGETARWGLRDARLPGSGETVRWELWDVCSISRFRCAFTAG